MSSTPAAPSRGSVLVVDDTPANLTLLARMLGDRGYRVRPVPSGRLALKAASSEPPDLILLDISMPEMDGFEVCRLMKEDPRLRDVPVIFITAFPERLLTGERPEPTFLITKPFQPETVKAAIGQALFFHPARDKAPA